MQLNYDAVRTPRVCSMPKTFIYKCSAFSVSGSMQVCAAFEARPSASVDAPSICHHCGGCTRTTYTSSQSAHEHLFTTTSTLHAVATICDDSNASPIRRRAHGDGCSEVTTGRRYFFARDRSRKLKLMRKTPIPGYTMRTTNDTNADKQLLLCTSEYDDTRIATPPSKYAIMCAPKQNAAFQMLYREKRNASLSEET